MTRSDSGRRSLVGRHSQREPRSSFHSIGQLQCRFGSCCSGARNRSAPRRATWTWHVATSLAQPTNIAERGASVIEHHENWTVMADPSGTAYCLTARRPNTGQLTAQSDLVTVEQLKAAKAALIESMPGWTPPAAYAVGVATQDGPVQWTHTNHRGIHGFPAVALSKVLGHRTGSASFPMDLRTFDAAIEVLRPAGACEHYEHPNLRPARQRSTIETDGGLPTGSQIVAVFIGDEDDPVVDDFGRQLRAELGID